MGVRTGAFATIWAVEDKGSFSNVRISTRRKVKGTDTYEQDFGGYVRFIGEAHTKSSGLKEKDRIKIGEFEVTNQFNKEKNVTYTNVAIFTFESADSGKPAPNQAPKEKPKVDEPVDDSDPF